MKRIGLLSDTHGFIDHRVFTFFEKCDEIWHAGDFGNMEVVEKLGGFKPLRGVFGNIDGTEIRKTFSKILKFRCEDVKVMIAHIGGYPGHYDKSVRPTLADNPPDLFISGHSHILKVIYDKKFNLLHINPGAAGNSGFHKVKTLLRFEIDGKNIRNLEIMEMPRKKEVDTPL
jgi:hypothetical protein